MTGAQKTGTAMASVLAILTLLLASQSLPAVQFMFGELRTFVSLPLFGPVAIAAVVGAVAPAWLPYMLPCSWPRHVVKRITRLLGFGIAFLMVICNYPSAVGAQYGLFAGSMAYMLWTMVASYVYRTIPGAEPPSLVDPPKVSGDDG